MDAKPGSLMERLNGVKDPRRREGQRYRFKGILGMLVLAALQGETSLRGMWLWGCARWERIAWPLDLWATEGPPTYGMVRDLLVKLDSEALGQALNLGGRWAAERAYSVDGKQLRGSKRATEPALQVITAAGHRYREVIAQGAVVAGDQVEAALALLHELPLEGKLVSLDAGLLQRATVTTIVEKGGPISERSKAIMAKCRP
jgi:hypothetical protein